MQEMCNLFHRFNKKMGKINTVIKNDIKFYEWNGPLWNKLKAFWSNHILENEYPFYNIMDYP